MFLCVVMYYGSFFHVNNSNYADPMELTFHEFILLNLHLLLSTQTKENAILIYYE